MSSKSLKQLVQHEAYTIVYFQTVGVVILAAIIWLFSAKNNGISVLLGGLAYCLPNLIFVWRVFRYVGAQQMTQFISAFFIGEAGKLVFSAILFLLIVKYLPVSLLSVLIGFIGAIVAFWIACIWYFSRQDFSKRSG